MSNLVESTSSYQNSSGQGQQSSSSAVSLLPESAITFGRTGIPLRVIRDDIALLINEFKKRNSLKIAVFTETWNELGWSHIHLACPINDARGRFMQGFYNALFPYILRGSNNRTEGIAAIYALYHLYFTQPPAKFTPTIRIRTSLRLWQCLITLIRQLLNEPLDILSIAIKEDIRYALYRLRMEDAWDLVVIQTPPQWLNHKPEQDDMLQWEDLLHEQVQRMEQQQQPTVDALSVDALNDISELDKAYTDAKLDMSNLPDLLGTASSQVSSLSDSTVVNDMRQLVTMSPQTLDGRRMIFELQKWTGHRNLRNNNNNGSSSSQ
ncbi:small nuclear RNA activating complex, subunit SNAP43-domain-containing protein [Syncephalis plumigaleata]|nr:small nuclear RNA activating complex, subunit SNAP43-domain-containing protein [Syncephalis plumigaleata]